MNIKFFSRKNVADFFGVHVATINREIKRGKLGIHRIGDRVLISDTQLEKYLKLCRQDSHKKGNYVGIDA